MATVKIPEAVIRVLAKMAADVVSSVAKQLVVDKTTSKMLNAVAEEIQNIEIPDGYSLRIRVLPR